jgi:hypothetical protein
MTDGLATAADVAALRAELREAFGRRMHATDQGERDRAGQDIVEVCAQLRALDATPW